MIHRRTCAVGTTCLSVSVMLAALLPGDVAAQAGYPQRPVRLIIPFAPGGGTDAVGRVLAQQLGERHGQTFIVQTHPSRRKP